jgi:hypothetical protein
VQLIWRPVQHLRRRSRQYLHFRNRQHRPLAAITLASFETILSPVRPLDILLAAFSLPATYHSHFP